VAAAVLFAVLVLVAGFPLSSLWSQHRELSSASAQLAQLTHENARLSQQERALKSPTEINRLAREEYQLVSPGQTLYDVLPASGKGTMSSATAAANLGNPANQPLVSPSNAPDMSPDPGLPQTPTPTPAPASTGAGAAASSSAHAAGASGRRSSFWGRVADTLEFWQ
jgi:cell division protein FtsB